MDFLFLQNIYLLHFFYIHSIYLNVVIYNVKMLIENRKENTALRIKACLYGVMDALCKAATPARYPAGAEHRDTRLLRQTVQYVDRHYAEKITVAAISAQCGYSSSHFMKRFHDLTGTSFAQYLIHFRLEKAATLLRGSRYTVLEIAARCGISRSYVSRIEKRALEKLAAAMDGWRPG